MQDDKYIQVITPTVPMWAVYRTEDGVEARPIVAIGLDDRGRIDLLVCASQGMLVAVGEDEDFVRIIFSLSEKWDRPKLDADPS